MDQSTSAIWLAPISQPIYLCGLKDLNKRMLIFICGSDENGAAIEIQAMKENSTPKKLSKNITILLSLLLSH
jgi:hypothetical protein